jgi:colanic acid biosynthesis glycosyl transferase WcaI
MANYATFALTSLVGICRAKRPDYLFIESPPLLTSIPARIAKLVWGVPYIFNVADLWPDAAIETGFLKKGPLYRLLLALEAWSSRGATYVNAATDGICDTLISRKRLPPEKVLFLPNGVDVDYYQPRDQDMELKTSLGLAGKRIILWAGTIGYSHGLECVLDAAKLLESSPEIHFLFLGNGSMRSRLEEIRRELNLTNVTFKDPVPMEQLARYYSIAECGLASLKAFPSHEGARPSKIFAVLASAKPVIFFGAGECARLVEIAQAGIVIPPEEPVTFARDVRALFTSPELMRQLGKNGRRFVTNHYQWSDLVTKWLERLDQTVATSMKATQVSATP